MVDVACYRFVGPATEVSVVCLNGALRELRGEGAAVAEAGWRLARLVLAPAQMLVLSRNDRLAWVTGPPGTGESLAFYILAASTLTIILFCYQSL